MIKRPALTRRQIPEAVAALLLAVQPRIRELSPEAQKMGFFRRLLNSRTAIVTRPVPLDRELAFWEFEDDAELEEFLFSRLLAAMDLSAMREKWKRLPKGYRPLVLVLEFERHRQFEGWTAVSNRSADMTDIVQSYVTLGLTNEGAALRRVLDRYRRVGNCDDMDGELEAAYSAGTNATPEIESRLPLILSFVRAHPEQFGIRS